MITSNLKADLQGWFRQGTRSCLLTLKGPVCLTLGQPTAPSAMALLASHGDGFLLVGVENLQLSFGCEQMPRQNHERNC